MTLEIVRMIRVMVLCGLVLAVGRVGWSEPVAYNVKLRAAKSATDRRLVEEDAVFTIDDSARSVTLKGKTRSVAIPFEDVDGVIFEVSTHARGGNKGWMLAGVVGALAIDSKRIDDYWCLLNYHGAAGAATALIELPKDVSQTVVERMRRLFEAKVTVTDLKDAVVPVNKQSLTDLKVKLDVKADAATHPLPERNSEKALVVVVCPPFKAKDTGKGLKYALFANGRIVAVNRMGTYSFAYLDPGDYVLTSSTGDAAGIRMQLAAGGEYYFQQDLMASRGLAVKLSRHSRELVKAEIGGAHFSNWKRITK